MSERTLVDRLVNLAERDGVSTDAHHAMHEAAETITALLASCVEFLPILERQLANINHEGAAEASTAFQFAKARVERMRAAIARATASPEPE